MGHAKVIDKVISDVGSIGGLDGPIRKVVVECYVRSLEYSHSKFSLSLLKWLKTYKHISGFPGSITVGFGDSFHYPRAFASMKFIDGIELSDSGHMNRDKVLDLKITVGI